VPANAKGLGFDDRCFVGELNVAVYKSPVSIYLASLHDRRMRIELQSQKEKHGSVNCRAGEVHGRLTC
jgi:hypothetical protein